ncbi:PDDEXK-like family protein [Bosea rubneri]|uniref:PD-(D/E)XK nuclease family protein n=1 Tax=Bosea rubneri TaxID=3075434 RepID=A0ABU3SG06_9HYPH|nr:PD-(D/E)XK nuclease family protein [Bosea sp. ZW T0_25]MDU0343735.1 PD-(D/E)XK nuclease family protein [Bosea sp. ZW T0_25]
MNDIAMLDDITGLIATLEAQNKQAAQSIAPAFTPFSFVESDELGLSRILGWLLDPNGTHAQGERFLEAFVTAFGIPWQPGHCASARVTLEAPTPRLMQLRRIDVLIACHDRAIAIENKPSAADQRGQVQDYFTHLDRHYQSGGHLLYLSGDGSGPSLESVGAEEAERRRQSGQLILKGYADLLPWLEACRGLCLAPRVRDFIAFFERHIRRRFTKGEKTVALSEQLVSDIVSSPDRVSSALNIIAAADALRERLITRLREEIAVLAAARGWTLLPEKRSVIQWSGFSIRYGANDELKFRLDSVMNAARKAALAFGVLGPVTRTICLLLP